MGDSYLIEIRLLGKAKHEVRRLIYNVNNKRGIDINRPIPHITLVGGFATNNESRLIKDFERISSETRIAKYTIQGIDTFLDNGVIYLDVRASDELESYRKDLRDALKNYCKLGRYDFAEPFEYHCTLSKGININRMRKIKNGIRFTRRYHHRMLRATLVKNSLILAEYDFCLGRLLTRQEALDMNMLTDTFKRCKNESSTTNKITGFGIVKVIYKHLVSWLHRFING